MSATAPARYIPRHPAPHETQPPQPQPAAPPAGIVNHLARQTDYLSLESACSGCGLKASHGTSADCVRALVAMVQQYLNEIAKHGEAHAIGPLRSAIGELGFAAHSAARKPGSRGGPRKPFHEYKFRKQRAGGLAPGGMK